MLPSGIKFENGRPVVPWAVPALEAEIESSVNDGSVSVNWQRPQGLLGDIANSIYANSVFPNRAVALAGAIAFMAGVAGRTYNTPTGTGLNQYLILIGRTAVGKDAASAGMNACFSSTRKEVPGIVDFQGPAHIASAQALLKHMSGSPCMVARSGEISGLLHRLSDPRANANDKALLAFLLDLFMYSGRGRILQGSIYSDSQKNTGPVESPSLTIFGDSTPQEFYSAIDEKQIVSGLVSRFTMIECEDVKPTYNPSAGSIPIPVELQTRLNTFALQCVKCTNDNTVISLLETEAANRFQLKYQAECQDKEWNDTDSPLSAIWHRAHLRLLRLGGLVAVGINPIKPLVEAEHYEWAKTLIDAGVKSVIRRFESGNVGEPNPHNAQHDLLINTLKSYVKTYKANGFNRSHVKHYGMSEQMQADYMLTAKYFYCMMHKHSAFKHSRDVPQAIRSLLKTFVENEWLRRVGGTETCRNQRAAEIYQIDLSVLAKM